jgi:hypothetical protein
MVHHEAVLAGDAPPRLADAVDDLYADDGVSCTICHMIEDEGLGEASTFSGRPKFTDKRVIFGPFADVATRPMQNLVRYTPTQGLHVQRSALCATCHTLVTEHHGTPFPEQTPYLEWRNSEFSDERDGADAEQTRTCQQCHMPATGATRIARSPMGFDFRGIPAREGFRSHAFVGGNAFMLDVLREHADELDVLAEPELLERMAAATRKQLAERTANVLVSALSVQGGVLSFSVTVENLTGHKFPTGYPARRAWLRIEVLDGDRTVFLCGDVDDAGRLRGIDDELAVPHVRIVEKASDVPVFEMVAADPDGAATTLLTRMVTKKKDNRLLPRGWRADDPGIADIAPVGVDGDTDFGAGGDTIACRIPVPEDAGARESARWPA